jgi:ABC-type proline/glycine betaine transport system substrate-binding protein
MRTAVLIFITILALGIGAYYYWIGSPFYAFQQAAIAAKDHDVALFDKYVDAANIIDHALDDLLVQPAMSTPGLSGFQSTVASGALTMAKASITKGALQSINKFLSPDNIEQPHTSFFQTLGADAAIAAPTRIAEAGSTRDGLKELLHAASHEMSGEVGKLKNVAFNRMLAYIQSHPNTVPGRLVNCPPGERSAHARQMLEDYGLTTKNFKGVADTAGGTDILGHESSKIGFSFFSPKISRQIVVQVELHKDIATGVWRIDRLANIKEVMDQVEENYDRDIHELVEYSLSGMSNSNMATDMRGMTERIKQNPAAQNLLKKWNLNLR